MCGSSDECVRGSICVKGACHADFMYRSSRACECCQDLAETVPETAGMTLAGPRPVQPAKARGQCRT